MNQAIMPTAMSSERVILCLPRVGSTGSFLSMAKEVTFAKGGVVVCWIYATPNRGCRKT